MGQESSESTGPRGSQSIERALAILFTFSSDHPSRSLKEICEITELTLPTAHRMTKALQHNGFIRQDPNSGLYSLGPSIARLARVMFQSGRTSELPAISRPYLQSLRDATGETAGLHIASPEGRICVAEVESRHMMRMSSGVGSTFPWHAGASSKVLLAGMSEPERKSILAPLDWPALAPTAAHSSEEFLHELDEVRARGYAVSVGETIPGATAVAVPVRDLDGRVVAAINVTGPALRWTRETMTEALPTIKDVAQQMGAHLGLEESSPNRGPRRKSS
ncbi:IclR family transcriptional regulator [Actinacidiphila sp. ITFR-21]|uniref:IclR family transcriptional regulator n=1 Tax=Actinacidiphila sp. ITFR-21 TaxID=3075199 RepID=UPI00288BDE51|nr:IclR family transcriptional regulator [Streptomyces sp. ITFR-21]WNI14262.1 IclR family transcriptional regulator [Streptomyces sp. ITFR-21]